MKFYKLTVILNIVSFFILLKKELKYICTYKKYNKYQINT